MVTGPEQTLTQRGHTDGQKSYEKILKITNRQRNSNEDHSKISSDACQSGCHRYIINVYFQIKAYSQIPKHIVKALERVEEKC